MKIGHSISITSGTVFRRSSSIFAPASLPNLHTWVRGDDPDRSINTSPDPDQYESLPNRGSGAGILSGGESATQPQVSTAWNLDAVPQFGSGRRLTSSLAASTYTGLHDGASDRTVYVRIRITSLAAINSLFTTYNGGTSNTGTILRVNTGGRLQGIIGNGSENSIAQSGDGTITTDSTLTAIYHKQGALVTLFSDTTSVADVTIDDPSGSDPLHTLVIGANNSGTSPLVGFAPEVIVYNEAHDAETRSKVVDYLARAVFS